MLFLALLPSGHGFRLEPRRAELKPSVTAVQTNGVCAGKMNVSYEEFWSLCFGERLKPGYFGKEGEEATLMTSDDADEITMNNPFERQKNSTWWGQLGNLWSGSGSLRSNEMLEAIQIRGVTISTGNKIANALTVVLWRFDKVGKAFALKVGETRLPTKSDRMMSFFRMVAATVRESQPAMDGFDFVSADTEANVVFATPYCIYDERSHPLKWRNLRKDLLDILRFFNKARHDAAGKIQFVAKQKLDRKKAEAKEKRATTKIQAAARGRQARAQMEEAKSAAKKVQAAARGRQARVQKEEEKRAATKVQAAARGRQARAQKEEESRAATKMQAAARGRQARAQIEKAEHRQAAECRLEEGEKQKARRVKEWRQKQRERLRNENAGQARAIAANADFFKAAYLQEEEEAIDNRAADWRVSEAAKKSWEHGGETTSGASDVPETMTKKGFGKRPLDV